MLDECENEIKGFSQFPSPMSDGPGAVSAMYTSFSFAEIAELCRTALSTPSIRASTGEQSIGAAPQGTAPPRTPYTPEESARLLAALTPPATKVGVPDEMADAVRKAVQLADVASDWNLYEVEIDGAMVGIYDLKKEFEAALQNTHLSDGVGK
ncbi:MAG: hypothetical protein JWM16_6377 [Verrucomicrobiales bacterium]|nr:hypothetical protein [Verrucomicrobiales bacterium]